MNSSTVNSAVDFKPQLIPGLLDQLKAASQPDADQEAGPVLAMAILEDAVKAQATDVHVDSASDHCIVRLRIDGRLLNAATVSFDDGRRLISQIRVATGLLPNSSGVATAEESRTRVEIGDEPFDIRVAVIDGIDGEKLSARLLPVSRAVTPISELGLPEDQVAMLREELESLSGLIIVAGPTGSGKTTTLYSLISELNLDERCLITLEDPVEYRIDGMTQVPMNTENGLSFDAGLRTALRLDPDSLMIGETRDQATARAVLAAATSGRLVFTTLHSADAVGAITSLRNWRLEEHEITSAVQIVLGQRLVRRLCPNCREQQTPSDSDRSWVERRGLNCPDQLYSAKGCSHCNGGYKGRSALVEVWKLTEDDIKQIRRGTDETKLRELLDSRDHQFLLDVGLSRVESGETSLNELKTAAPHHRPQPKGPMGV